MHRATLAVALAVVITVAVGCTADDGGADGAVDDPARPTTTVACPTGEGTTEADIAYATEPGVDPGLLSLDLAVPARSDGCTDVPVVVWVHGGGFAIGDKGNGVADKRAWALDHGWAFASVNYRLSAAEPGDDPDGVRHPTHATDVAAAVAWLVDEGPARGLDPDRIALVGHSAGAFLVALLATDPTYLGAVDRIAAAATLDTRYDIADAVADRDDGAAMYRNAFGEDPAVWRSASPLTHAGTPDIAPLLVVTRGSAERIAGATEFADAVVAGGGEASVVDAGPLSHAEVSDVLGRADDAVVTPPVTELLETALA